MIIKSKPQTTAKVQHYTYPLGYYQRLFSEERWAEIEKVINNWTNPVLEDGKKFKQLWMNPETSHTWLDTDSHDEVNKNQYSYEYHQKHVLSKYLQGEELDMVNGLTLDMVRENRLQRILENSKKLAPEEYSGAIFTQSNEFFISLDDYYGMYEEKDRDDWVFAATEVWTLTDNDLPQMIEDRIEHHTSNLEDEDYVHVGDIPEDLKTAWKKFVEKNAQVIYWEDSKIIIILDKN